MATNLQPSGKPFLRIPVGEHIAEEMVARGLSVDDLSLLLEMPQFELQHLLNGHSIFTQALADKLEQLWGIRASYWLNLDSKYQTWLAEHPATAKTA